MRHLVKSTRLNRSTSHLDLMLRNMATSIILYEQVQTTEPKAKLVKPIMDRLINKSKTMTVPNAYRALNAYLLDKNASKKIVEQLKERYKDRTSGYCRIVHLAARRSGDAASMVQISLV